MNTTTAEVRPRTGAEAHARRTLPGAVRAIVRLLGPRLLAVPGGPDRPVPAPRSWLRPASVADGAWVGEEPVLREDLGPTRPIPRRQVVALGDVRLRVHYFRRTPSSRVVGPGPLERHRVAISSCRRLTTATEAIEAKPEPLTASFKDVPSAHDGAGTTFTFRLQFHEAPDVSYTVLRDEAFEVTGGEVRKAQRVDRRDDLRQFEVEPTSNGTVSIRLPATSSLQHERRDLHERRLAAVELELGDGGRPDGALGGRRRGRGERRRDDRVHGELGPGGVEDRDGGLRHLRRQRDGGRRLHGGGRHVDLRRGGADEDGRGDAARRHARRGGGDVHLAAVERLGSGDHRRRREQGRSRTTTRWRGRWWRASGGRRCTWSST